MMAYNGVNLSMFAMHTVIKTWLLANHSSRFQEEDSPLNWKLILKALFKTFNNLKTRKFKPPISEEMFWGPFQTADIGNFRNKIEICLL